MSESKRVLMISKNTGVSLRLIPGLSMSQYHLRLAVGFTVSDTHQLPQVVLTSCLISNMFTWNNSGASKQRRPQKAAFPKKLAPQVGLEPTTLRLTAECSAIELLRNERAQLRIMR